VVARSGGTRIRNGFAAGKEARKESTKYPSILEAGRTERGSWGALASISSAAAAAGVYEYKREWQTPANHHSVTSNLLTKSNKSTNHLHNGKDLCKGTTKSRLILNPQFIPPFRLVLFLLFSNLTSWILVGLSRSLRTHRSGLRC